MSNRKAKLEQYLSGIGAELMNTMKCGDGGEVRIYAANGRAFMVHFFREDHGYEIYAPVSTDISTQASLNALVQYLGIEPETEPEPETEFEVISANEIVIAVRFPAEHASKDLPNIERAGTHYLPLAAVQGQSGYIVIYSHSGDEFIQAVGRFGKHNGEWITL